MKSIIKKTLSIVISTVILLASIATVGAASNTTPEVGASDTVYPGGKIRVNYSFAKDIPEGIPCFLFESVYDSSSLEYDSINDHLKLPHFLVVPHPDWEPAAVSWSAFTAIGPEVKAGEKIASLVFNVTKEIKNVSKLKFSYGEFQLYNNNGKELDDSCIAYDVEVLSYGNVPNKDLLGDVDSSGNITVMDATCIQKYIANLTTLTPEQIKVADYNGDNSVNVMDATLIQKHLVKK